jgi:hypothetical protein
VGSPADGTIHESGGCHEQQYATEHKESFGGFFARAQRALPHGLFDTLLIALARSERNKRAGDRAAAMRSGRAHVRRASAPRRIDHIAKMANTNTSTMSTSGK